MKEAVPVFSRGHQMTGTVVEGPPIGFAWHITRISVAGLSSGVVGFYRNDTTSPPLAVASAAEPVRSFPKHGCVLMGGDHLVLSPLGTTAATGVTAEVDAILTPARLLGSA